MASPAEDTTFVRPQWHRRCNRCPESTKRWCFAQPHPRWQHVPIAFLDTVPNLEVLDAFARAREPWSTPHAVYRLPDSEGRKPINRR